MLSTTLHSSRPLRTPHVLFRYLNNRPPVLADRVATVITGELRAVDNKTNVERLNRLTNQTDVPWLTTCDA